MRMSTKSRFAVNALIDLSLREGGGPVALAAIAGRQDISLSYLEQLFSRLRKNGIVSSTRGPGGGYTLGRDAADVSMADIITAVEDEVVEGERGMEFSGALWDSLHEVMLKHMATISLRTLVDEQVAKGVVVQEAKPPRKPVGISPAPVVKPLRSTAPNSVFAFGQSFNR
jgi:Rrf2 family transcriptional regulator, iron-sulfur cluster assembly transcription factor